MMDRNGDPKGIFAFAFAPARRVRLQGRKRSSRPVLLELGESISVYVAVILFAASASPSPSISIAEAQTQPQPQTQTQTQTQPQNNTTDATPESESVTMPPSLSVPVSSSTTPPTSNIAQPPVLPVLVPTPTVAPTVAPANAPANAPTYAPTYGPTTSVLSPNGFATEPPTSHPTLTPKPTNAPTSAPTLEPSTTPTLSSRPSVLPSLSLRPSVSSSPTGQPSAAPSAQPSWQVPSFKETKFRQPIQVANGRELDKDAIVAFQVIYQIQTIDFSGLPEDVVREKITTECTIDKQQIKKDEIEPERARGERRIYDYHDPYINEPIWLEDEFGNITSSFDHPTQFLQRRRRRRGRTRTRTRTLGRTLGRSRRRAQAAPESVTLLVDFTMTYSSSYYNITTYPKEFQTHTNSNLEEMLKQMQDLKINVTEVGKIQRLVVITPAPSLSVSAAPSSTPTGNPTITARPSGLPSLSGTKVPEISGSVKTSVIAISVSILVALAILVTGVFFWYRKRQTNRGLDESKMDVHGQPTTSDPNRNPSDVESNARWNNTTGTGTGTGADLNLNTNTNTKFGTPESKAYGSAFGKPSSEAPSGLAGVGVGVGVGGGRGVVSPNGSLHSNPSLVSEGDPFGGDDSVDEADITQNLADELDKFQDHNMEIMRANVEENLAGCDGMMSQAVARALIDDVDHDTSSDIYWGGDIDISAPEIEASALGSVMDWLKRNDKASDREKRDFFQESLNNMTASVRYNVVHPEDGARTIHECAGLLGLQLAVEIPVTTIVISGMRKSTTEDDIRKRFSPFGDISIAAVAPKHKGYGILRFTSDVAVDRVMSRFRTEEIVLDDVAVQLRVIKPGSNTQASEPNSII